jgi:cation:H+ antiporter
MLLPIVFLLLGGVALIGGSELLVRGAARVAIRFGISPLVVGLTIVAFGTSAPEFLVSGVAAWRGDTGIALGNVVGSNVFNLLVILGLSALVAPLTCVPSVLRFDVPFVIATAVFATLAGLSGNISALEGGLLFASLLAYLLLCVARARRGAGKELGDPDFDPVEARRSSALVNAALIVGGLALLGLGSHLFVDGAVQIARLLGMSELVIGITIVAAGTSLPEVATSLMAAWRGERDIAVGNVLGSNVFNTAGVLGAAAMVGGGVEIPDSALRFDLPVMVAVSIFVLPVLMTGLRVSRLEGAALFGAYVVYVALLLLDAVQSPWHRALATTVAFAAPLLAAGLVYTETMNARRRMRPPHPT